MEERLAKKIILVLLALIVIFLFSTIGAVKDSQRKSKLLEKERLLRLNTEEERDRLYKEIDSYKERLSLAEKRLREEKKSSEKLQQEIQAQQKLTKKLKEEIEKLNRLKEALEEDLKEVLGSSTEQKR